MRGLQIYLEMDAIRVRLAELHRKAPDMAGMDWAFEHDNISLEEWEAAGTIASECALEQESLVARIVKMREDWPDVFAEYLRKLLDNLGSLKAGLESGELQVVDPPAGFKLYLLDSVIAGVQAWDKGESAPHWLPWTWRTALQLQQDFVAKCQCCKAFRPSGWECTLSMAKQGNDALESVLECLLPVDGVEHGQTDLFWCPECAAVYMRTYGQEWDSFNEIMNDLVRVVPVSAETVRGFLAPKKAEPDWWIIEKPGHCLYCNSTELTRLRETKTGTQVVVWCRCRACGRDGFMDCYEDPEDLC